MEDWVLVSTGHGSAVVRRSADGRRYAKTGSGQARADLSDEHDRLLWLATTDLPAPHVLGWEDDGEVATLTTAAAAGVPMSDLPASSAPEAARSLARFLQRLHGVSRESCPFERWLAVTVGLARVHADEGAEASMAALLDGRPRAEELELGDLVVCHGDACLPNFLADPDTLEVTGMIDVGRLGVADRHLDLALATRSMSDTTLNPAYGPAAAEALLAAYDLETDPWRLDFYRLLDSLG